MKRTLITATKHFVDIDALACIVAYQELLGENSVAYVPGPLNLSVTPTIRTWGFEITKTVDENEKFDVVIVDTSNPENFDEMVKKNIVTEIYDHHPGFEEYWKATLGDSSNIEQIGACATLIWEQYIKRQRQDSISSTSANLLYTAILSNTLNFKAQITKDRDTLAFQQIEKYTTMPPNWAGSYFTEVESFVFQDIPTAIKNDSKKIGDFWIGQIELWDNLAFFNNHLSEIEAAMFGLAQNNKWFLTSPSISEGINRFYTKSPEIKNLLASKVDVVFTGDVGVSSKLYLRKELLPFFDKH